MATWTEGDTVRAVERALAGDQVALEAVIVHCQNDVYNLAVRMLWSPEDAADATQEILMKVVTHLSSFRGASAFRTWVYRIAVNHLRDVRRSRVERESFTFTSFGDSLGTGLVDPPAGWSADPEQALLVEDVKIGCTMGMLLCLSRDDRVAYILGDVFELTTSDAANVLEISAVAYRQRLSRARSRLRQFVEAHCGLVNDQAACRCERRVHTALETGRIRQGNPQFASPTAPSSRRLPVIETLPASVEDMERLHRVAGLFQSHPKYEAPGSLIAAVRRVLNSGQLKILS